MSVSGHASNRNFTPKNLLSTVQTTPAKQVREDAGLQLALELEACLGTTTSTVDAFDTDSDTHLFACCAGSAAVLARVDENFIISQQLYCAGQSVTPSNSSTSYYNASTPTAIKGTRYATSLKDREYGLGFTPSVESSPASSGKGSVRSREITCVSLTSKTRLLAAGETGYNPRVLLFSTAPEASSHVPLSILTDHTFGVTSLAFSQDSHWLCTLGNSYDGFILIYQISHSGSARLHSSNKCSNVSTVTWMGSAVISIGLRHVKLWRLEQNSTTSPSKTRFALDTNLKNTPGSPSPKTFVGRNCLLGELIDATFSTAISISDCKAVICTTQGDVCILDDTERSQRFQKIAKVGFGISCVAFDRKQSLIWLTGVDGKWASIDLDILVEAAKSPSPNRTVPFRSCAFSDGETRSNNIACGMVRDCFVALDSNKVFKVLKYRDDDAQGIAPAVFKTLAAHRTAVLGVCALPPKVRHEDADFLTYSTDGVVLFWTIYGVCIRRLDTLDTGNSGDDGVTNELTALVASQGSHFLVTGDKRGTLRRFDLADHRQCDLQAHSGEITSIATVEMDNTNLVASCGRDRTVQVFRDGHTGLELLQTLDDHTSTVTSLAFLDGPSVLLSMSSDRTIVVRKLVSGIEGPVAYDLTRVITLKSSPVSFSHIPGAASTIVVSTMDKQIQRYDLHSGRLLHTFKALDPETSETGVMGSLEIHDFDQAEMRVRLLLGVFLNNKSIRIYDYNSGSMLAKQSGQSSISGIKFISYQSEAQDSRMYVISSSLDGTVTIWNLTLSRAQIINPSRMLEDQASPWKQLSPSNQPLRRILSSTDMSKLHQSFEEDDIDMTPMRRLAPARVRQNKARNSPSPSMKSPNMTNGTANRSSSQNEPASGTSPETNTTSSRKKRPSLNAERRSKHPNKSKNLNNDMGQMCKSIRFLRDKITSCPRNALDVEMVKDLCSELELTTKALRDKHEISSVESNAIVGGGMDDYLAKFVDERLALRLKHDENQANHKASNGRPKIESPSKADGEAPRMNKD